MPPCMKDTPYYAFHALQYTVRTQESTRSSYAQTSENVLEPTSCPLEAATCYGIGLTATAAYCPTTYQSWHQHRRLLHWYPHPSACDSCRATYCSLHLAESQPPPVGHAAGGASLLWTPRHVPTRNFPDKIRAPQLCSGIFSEMKRHKGW